MRITLVLDLYLELQCTVDVDDMPYTFGHTQRGQAQVQMTWITRLELHCDAGTSGVPILLRLVTLTPGDRTQDT